MKLFGSLERLVKIVFRKSGFDVTVEPSSQSTGNSIINVPDMAGTTQDVVLSTQAQTLTNKTIDGDNNTLSDISISSLKTVLGDADEVILRDNAGAVVSAKLVNANVDAAAAIAESKLALDHSTSSLNTAISGKVSKSGDTMSGNLAMGGNKVTGLGAPSANGDALRYDELGAANGIATLDGSGKVPSAQLPSYVDDVLEYANLAALPGTGTAGIIYVTVDNNKAYRWTGSVYIEISPSEVNSVNGATGIVVLDTDDISEGSTNLYFTNTRARDAITVADSASVDLTYSGGQISAAVLPAGVDHDALSGFVANEHVDHSAVSIATGANSGLSGGGDITATRNLVIDPSNATAIVGSLAGTEELLVDDGALKKVTTQQIADLAAGSAAQSFTWTDGSATRSCSHSFSTRAVLVEVYDENYETVLVDIVDRSSTSQVDLTRSEATVGGNWTVVIRN